MAGGYMYLTDEEFRVKKSTDLLKVTLLIA
jgi:hypothetical protein